MVTTIRVESVRGRRQRHGGSSVDPWWAEQIARNWAAFRVHAREGKRRAKKVGVWKREHAINATARARQLVRTRTHLRAAPGIFVHDECAVFVCAQVRTVGCVNDIRYRAVNATSRQFSLRCSRTRAMIVEPYNYINEI